MKMKKILGAMLCAAFSLASCAQASSGSQNNQDISEAPQDSSVVFMTKEISPEAILKLYKALGREAKGKVAVKISTGEPGGHNFLNPDLIKDFVKETNGTIVECNTAYGGGRYSTEDHLRAAEEHGFTAIAPVDIMDAEGSETPSRKRQTSKV